MTLRPKRFLPAAALLLPVALVLWACTEHTCKCGDDVVCGYVLVDLAAGTDTGEPPGPDLIGWETEGGGGADLTGRDADGGTVDSYSAWPDSTDLVEEIEPELPLPPLEEGTPDLPYLVEHFPYVQENDTTLSETSMFDLYNCADWLWEEGPEFYYQVVVPQAGTLKVEVSEADGVDVDIHLLTDLQLDGVLATACVSRANTLLVEEDIQPGGYWVVIDSYSEEGISWPGGYRVAFELDVWDEWQEVDVAPGIVWKKKIYWDYAGGVQTVNVLEADLSHPSVVVKPYWEGGCIHPGEVGPQEGAVAAMNAGFFSSGCNSMCLIRIDGELKVTNQFGTPRRSLGIDADGSPMFESVDAGADWPEAHQAIGGHPNLLTGGETDIWPWENSGFYTARHPRTALGLTGDGKLLLVTVDGRTEAGAGMTEQELAQHLLYLGATDGINLDGGGSTTMWVKEMSVNGIVNHPSDNNKPDHHGERWVSDALLVFSLQ